MVCGESVKSFSRFDERFADDEERKRTQLDGSGILKEKPRPENLALIALRCICDNSCVVDKNRGVVNLFGPKLRRGNKIEV